MNLRAEGKKVVVVNADDLGLHEDINRGIQLAHEKGIVTSASIVACGRAFEHALEIIQAYPLLGIGVHLTLIEELPLSKPGHARSLVNAEGRFWSAYPIFAKRVLLGKIEMEDVFLELKHQVQRVVDAGIQPSHLDLK